MQPTEHTPNVTPIRRPASPDADFETRIESFLDENSLFIRANRNSLESPSRESWMAYDVLKSRWGSKDLRPREYEKGILRITAALNV